jgi:hypothetical protein
MSYTDAEIEAIGAELERIAGKHKSGETAGFQGGIWETSAAIIRQLLAQRDEARDEASDMRDEAYIDASAEKPISWQSMHEAECAARHAALADLAAAKARIHALEEALKTFAALSEVIDATDHGAQSEDVKIIHDSEGATITVGDFRRARSTLSPQKEGE